MTGAVKYEDDFYGWATEQAALLRAGRVSEADLAHIAEEIESMGRGEKRELVNRLAVLLLHLLKWAYQPKPPGQELAADDRRTAASDPRHLRDNPSLRSSLDETLQDAFGDAVLRAELGPTCRATCSRGPARIPSSKQQMTDSGRSGSASPPWHPDA